MSLLRVASNLSEEQRAIAVAIARVMERFGRVMETTRLGSEDPRLFEESLQDLVRYMDEADLTGCPHDFSEAFGQLEQVLHGIMELWSQSQAFVGRRTLSARWRRRMHRWLMGTDPVAEKADVLTREWAVHKDAMQQVLADMARIAKAHGVEGV